MQMETRNVCCYKWDSKLLLSNPNFGQKLHHQNYDPSMVNKSAFPSDYLLACFSQQAYKDKNYIIPDDWELLTTAANTDRTNGYFGVAFWNSKLCQVVVAHRGTKVSNIGALISDLLLALNKEKTGQSQSAATFVDLVSGKIKTRLSENGPHFQLSITGHSLGAWLGQVTTFTVKYFKRNGENFVEDENYSSNIHAHTVVFESPGCKQAFVKLVKYFVPRYVRRKYGNYDSLDMTVYLSKLNPINSINEHVGTIYHVQSQTHSIKDTVKLFDPVTGRIIKQMVLDFHSGIVASSKLVFRKIIPFGTIKPYTTHVNENEHSLNVFNEKELDFIKDWNHVISLKFPKILQFKRDNALPDFELDDEYNLIKGQDINNTIACIKRMRPTKMVILELLKSDANIKVHYEIFKLKTQQFEKDLLQFSNYYFKDKYGLKNFLKTDTQILHIQVAENGPLECDLETSILNNVFTYYKNIEPTTIEDYANQSQCAFITWNTLQEVLSTVPDIFEISEDYKLNLLIIECFEIEHLDREDVERFLKRIKIKIILLSTTELSWKKDIPNIQEIIGFNGNVQFQDLTDNCQKQFFKQNNMKLHEKQISLNDIIITEFPFSSDVYNHLNQVISADVLLELMLTPITEAIVLDCPFNNSLTGVVCLDLFCEVNPSKIIELKPKKELVFIMQSNENKKSAVDELIKANFIIKDDINFIQECLENYNKIVYLFSYENDKLFLTRIFNKEFYIERQVTNQKFLSLFIFEDLSNDLDLYYVCGDKNQFKKYVTNENKRKFRFISSEREAKKKMKSAKENTHLLRIENEELEWLYSCGQIEDLRKYLEPKKSFADEQMVLDEDITIISGEPGIGKSSIIGLQYMKLQNTHWVFAIPLRHSFFNNLHSEIDFDCVAEFILQSCKMTNSSYCVQHLLSYCLKNETKLPICLLFDAFDEIHEENTRKKVIDLINFFKYSSKVKILITTRKYRCKELENGISVFASYFEPFDTETIAENFLTNFWSCQLHLLETSTDVHEFRRFAKNILQNAEDLFGETISSFIGIPMHLRMIAEIITPTSSSLAKSTSMDILNLFQKYTQMRYDLYMKKCGVTQNKMVQQWLSEHISSKLYQLAISKMFDINMQFIDYNDMEELNNVGIIQSNVDGILQYEFLHDSVRDYFVAYFLKLWLELRFQVYHANWDVEKFIVCDFLLYPWYKEMRFFLNLHIKNSLVSNERLKTCEDKLHTLWKENPDQFFVDHESALHICVKENLCYLVKHFLFPITNKINKTELLSKRNNNLETPVLIAASNINLNKNVNEDMFTIFLEELEQCEIHDIKTVLLATVFTYFVSDTNINTFKSRATKYINIQNTMQHIQSVFEQGPIFLQACTQNNLVKVNNVVKQYQNDTITRKYLLLITNDLKETCLHLTTNIEIVELLERDADKNAQDHHGMTPLSRAIKRGNTEIACALIKKGTNINIPDDMGNCPLNHSAKYDNVEVAKLLLSSKTINIDIDHSNIFGVTPLMLAAKNGNESLVRLLLDKSANVHAADWNGMTPLYHAVKGNNTNLIRLFKQKDADIDVQDRFEITPLLYSITKGRWNLVTSLLDNGADVNIGNKWNNFPIPLLIKMDKPAIIKKIFKKYEQVIKDETTLGINQIKIDMLTEKEKNYINNLLNLRLTR